MPVEISHNEGVAHVRAWGEYTAEEMRAGGLSAVEGATEETQARVILDVSGSISLRERPTAVILESARTFAERAPVIHRVAIVAPDDLVYGLMRMAAAFSESHGLDSRAFRTVAEGEAWLRGED